MSARVKARKDSRLVSISADNSARNSVGFLTLRVQDAPSWSAEPGCALSPERFLRPARQHILWAGCPRTEAMSRLLDPLESRRQELLPLHGMGPAFKGMRLQQARRLTKTNLPLPPALYRLAVQC